MNENEVVKAYEAGEIINVQVYDYDLDGNIVDAGSDSITYREVTGDVERNGASYFVNLIISGGDIVSAKAR